MAKQRLLAVDACNGLTYIGTNVSNRRNNITLRNYIVRETALLAAEEVGRTFECGAFWSYTQESTSESDSVTIFNPVAIHRIRSKRTLEKLFED